MFPRVDYFQYFCHGFLFSLKLHFALAYFLQSCRSFMLMIEHPPKYLYHPFPLLILIPSLLDFLQKLF